MPLHGTDACPLCQGAERVTIRLMNGEEGHYCPICKYIEPSVMTPTSSAGDIRHLR